MMAGNEQAKEMEESAVGGAVTQEMLAATMENMPLRQLISFVPGITWETIGGLLAVLNAD